MTDLYTDCIDCDGEGYIECFYIFNDIEYFYKEHCETCNGKGILLVEEEEDDSCSV